MTQNFYKFVKRITRLPQIKGFGIICVYVYTLRTILTAIIDLPNVDIYNFPTIIAYSFRKFVNLTYIYRLYI